MNHPLVRALLLSLSLCLLESTAAWAAPPTISGLPIRGLQAGGVTTLTIDGADLLPEPRLILPFPVASQVVKEGATANRVQIDVTLDAGVVPGLHPLRVATTGGVSDLQVIGVDQLPQVPFAPEIAAIPVALHGSLAGNAILKSNFTGTAGQRIVVEVEAKRLGSNLNPVLHLYDTRRVLLAWSQTTRGIFGDARLLATLPTDGQYTVEIHDALYRGAEPGFFRLKIGALHYADLTFPLAVRKGTTAQLSLVSSNLPPETLVDADLTTALTDIPARWPVLPLLSGSPPRVVASDFDEVLETPVAAGQFQTLAVPIGVSGRLAAAGEQDQYKLTVTPGAVLRFDVLAHRLGSPVDGVLSIRKEDGTELAASDDRPGTTDPGLDFTVPGDVTTLVVVLKDLQQRGGVDFVYRVSVAPAAPASFQLELFNNRWQTPQNGVAIARIRANRTGYNGPIKLTVNNLPAGVTVTGDEIPTGATDALLTLQGAGAAFAQQTISIAGESTDPNVPLRRAALAPATVVSNYQPWLRGDLAAAVVPNGPLSVIWEDVAAKPSLPLGAMLAGKIKITRAEGTVGAVRLSLLTSQIMPQKTIKENNVDKQVDDPDRAIRLDSVPMIAGDALETPINILVPADLPQLPYDVAVQAELLGPDNTTVLATALTPARRLPTTQPFAIQLAGEPKVEAKSGSGDSGSLSGQVIRSAGFALPVTVTLIGLPAEIPAPSVDVAADQTEFVLPVAFPHGTPLGELPNVRLVVQRQANPTTLVRSTELPIALTVVQGGPPPALYRLFEDEAAVVSMLNEGGGQISLDTDRYSGTSALRITPDQRFRAKFPGLGVKIAETPAEGEFRYLRFAWKKKGGVNILLQLAANGAFGPVVDDTSRPAYRYEAGQPNPFKGAALKVDENLPNGWVVVTRDLFADFGAMQLDGLALTASDGEYALFDHLYLARTMEDLSGCPAPLPVEPPLAIFEDQPEFATNLTEGAGTATVVNDLKLSGTASLKVTPDQKFNPALPGLGLKIRENPGPGEYRYLTFAWKKQGGTIVCLQLNHDGQFGQVGTNPAKFRYDAGTNPAESYGGALRLNAAVPAEFTVVTRDLFADFGEFTLNGLALSPVDGEFALFDRIYLGRNQRDFELIQP